LRCKGNDNFSLVQYRSD